MKNFLNKYKYQIFLSIIVSILFLVNYRPGTYLSGWDNLQTELNPGLAVKRALFSVWEEYQSFGLTAGMAHTADLPRAIFLWIMSFAIPENMIRYFYHFLMLLLGGLGILELLKKTSAEVIAFLGSLFYMLNLGTLQIFYLPFESFSTFFALLPWGIWIFMKLIKENKLNTKHLILFFLINLLGTPSFYTQQLFVVYILVLGCIALGKLKNIKRIILAFSLILIINSFWILPQIYFLKTNDGWITQSKSNQIATEDTVYQNLEKGTISNFLKLEGFYFDLKGIKNTYLFAPWKDHFSGVFGLFSYVLSGLMILGFAKSITSAVKQKQNQEQTAKGPGGFLIIYILCASALLLATPPFSWINELVRQIPIINQIFRSPFTKFIIPYSLIYSYFVVVGIKTISSKLKSFHLFLGTCFLVILIYSLPAFNGYFFSPEMKVKIPGDYHQVMEYFKTADKNKRIALLPDYTFWGWFFNKWGYNGSGFIWYGIEQPIVSRTFDVWSPKSESYFWEQKQALEAENLIQYEKVLDKYNIDYLLMDYSLIPLVSSYKSLATDRIESLLSKSQKVSLVFRGENIALYQVSHSQKTEKFITLSSGLKNIGPESKLMADDRAYSENGDYISENNFDFYYPFADLTTQTRIKDKYWSLEETTKSFSINSNILLNPDDYQFYFQQSSKASIFNEQEITELKLNLSPFYQNKQIKINFEKLLVKSFNVTGFNNNLTEFPLIAPELPQKYGYLIKIRSKNIKGSPLFFYVTDQTKKQSIIEEKLRNKTEYFILPYKFDYGLGYSFVFQNKFYKNYPSQNILEEVSVYLFPYEQLKSAKFIKKDLFLTNSSFTNNYKSKKSNYFTYNVSINNETVKQFNNLILYQSYSPGWVAFSNGKMLPHVKVNNWANGWLLDNNSTNIKIFFWPQYLEFLGFGLLGLTLIFILLYRPKIKVDEKNN
jgi:hypothetical protein